MEEDSRRRGTPRRGSRRWMSRKKISEMRRFKGGIPLFIGCWPGHLKRLYQYKNDTWPLPRKTKSTESVANKKWHVVHWFINQFYIRPRTCQQFTQLIGRPTWTRGQLMVSQKSSNSITRPYVSSNERQAMINQIGEVNVPSVQANLVRLWTRLPHGNLTHHHSSKGKLSKMVSSILY